MIAIRTNAPQVAATLREMAKAYPREFEIALSTFGVALKAKIEAAFRAASSPLSFAPWDAFTILRKAKREAKHARTAAFWTEQSAIQERKRQDVRFTGQTQRSPLARNYAKRRTELMRDFKARAKKALSRASFYTRIGGHLIDNIRYSKIGKRAGVRVGFLSILEPYARKFQTAKRSHPSKRQRHVLHMYGIKDMSYNRPAREVIMPFVRDPNTAREAARIIAGRIKSIFEKAAAKAKAARAA